MKLMTALYMKPLLPVSIMLLTFAIVDVNSKEIKNTDSEYDEYCHDVSNKEKVTGLCEKWIQGVEIEKFSMEKLEICVKFPSFPHPEDDPVVRFCVKLSNYPAFWVIVIGVPLALCLCICVTCYLCCTFTYYMCCCCLCGGKPPNMPLADHIPHRQNTVAPA